MFTHNARSIGSGKLRLPLY